MAKTTAQKLAAAVALVAKYEAQIVAEAAQSDVREGDSVTIKFGRADTVRNIEGRIVGVADTDAGKIVAVIDSELNVYKVHVRNVVDNATAAARKPSEVNTVDAPAVDDAAIVAFENEGGLIASDDPLSEA